MDPFSITVGALGITQFAVSSIVQLKNTIDNTAEARELITDISTSLTNIQRPLAALATLDIPDAIQADLKKTGVAETVNDCGKACNDFDTNIQKWTKHSTKKKLTLRDRLTVGVWNVEKIRTFRARVNSCQATVQFAVQSAQLLTQARSTGDSSTLKLQLLNLESSVREHLDLCKQRRSETNQRLATYRKPLPASSESDSDDEPEPSSDDALAAIEVEQQCKLLEDEVVSHGVIFAQIRAGRTDQQIGDVLVEEGSKLMAGMPESAVGKMDQRVGNLTVRKKSQAIVGIYAEDVRF